MATEFAKTKYSNSVASIEVVNEPLGVPTDTLKKYYKDAYARVRKHTDAIAVVISDKFIDPSNSAWASTWKGFMTTGYDAVIEDSHQYTVFSEGQIQMNAQARQDSYCAKASSLQSANRDKWQVVGEWTAAFTDCARSLNGRDKGARYDGTFPGVKSKKGSCGPKRGPASNFSQGYKDLLARFFAVQKETYEKGSGWIYWTWKVGFIRKSYIPGTSDGLTLPFSLRRRAPARTGATRPASSTAGSPRRPMGLSATTTADLPASLLSSFHPSW